MRKSTHDRRTTVESGTLNPRIRPRVNTRLQLQVNFIYFNTKLVAYPTNDYNMLTYIERPATSFNIAGSGLPRRVIVGESKDSYCFWGDWGRDDAVDVFGGLDSIGSLASSNLWQNSMLISDTKFGRTTSRRGLVVGKEVLKGPRDSILANAKFESNMTSGDAIGGQRKNVFLLSRADEMHWEWWISDMIS